MLRRLRFAAAVSAAGMSAALALAAGGARADVIRAEVRGVTDKGLRNELQQAVGRAPGAPGSRVEARRRARDAGERVIQVLRSEGFYDYVVEPDIGDGDTPEAFVAVTTGPRSTIQVVKIEWIGASPDAQTIAAADKAVALKAGDPGRAADVLAAEGRIVSTIQRRGYADAQAGAREVVVDHADYSVNPTFRIAAGPMVRFDGVRVISKGRTKPRWVSRLAAWKPGEIYRPEPVAEFERRLLDTGVYDSVTVALAPASEALPNGERPVVVSLADRPRGVIELGASYSTSEGVGADSRWILPNRFGRADTLTNSLIIAQIDSRLQTELALPDWGHPQQTLKLTAALYRDNTPAYLDTAAGLSADLTHRYGKTSFLSYGVSVDSGDTIEKEQADFVTESRNRHLTSFALIGSFALDRSNDPLNPTRGWKLDGQVQPTAALGDGSVTYVKAVAQASTYWPFGRLDQTVIAARVRAGAIFGGDVPLVPAPDRFFAGGGGSVRGYGYQEVGPRFTDNTPEGGLSLFESSLEVRRAVTEHWQVAAFADAGTVGLHTTPDFTRLQVGVGLGVRYNMGFGPLRLDIATPLTAREGDSAVQVYFSIGQSF